MTAITEKALDTSMQYDTESAWKLFGKVLKKLAADLKGPWGCVKMPGGVSIFHTLHKKEVFGQLNPLEKCFKICYVYGKRKPM